jgi:hypothetical protein
MAAIVKQVNRLLTELENQLGHEAGAKFDV